MGRSSAPRKKYVRGKVISGGHLPLQKVKAEGLEMQALIALEMFSCGNGSQVLAKELAFFVVSCSFLPDPSKENVALVTRASNALSSLYDRGTSKGRWVPSGDELRALKECVPPLLSAYKASTREEVLEAVIATNRKFYS